MQEQREDRLIVRLKEIIQTSRHATGEPTWHRQRSVPPVTTEELAQAEAQLGFALPTFLRRIYLEVGNGGFGPGYGLLPLNDHPLDRVSGIDTLLAAYQGMRSMSQQNTGLTRKRSRPCGQNARLCSVIGDVIFTPA